MEYKYYDAVKEATDNRFSGPSFHISCFDMVQEIPIKPVAYFCDAIIIAYDYFPNYYDNLNIVLQDVDYIIVHRQEGQECIRYCDVIDTLVGCEISGAIKPNPHMYLEKIELVENGRVPMYRILWCT